MLCCVVAVARAASGPQARERAREGDRRGRRDSGGPSGRGWGGPRLRCGAGLEGAVARATPAAVSTAGSEHCERPRSAARRASRRDWGFQVGLCSTTHLYTTLHHTKSVFISIYSILRCTIYARDRSRSSSYRPAFQTRIHVRRSALQRRQLREPLAGARSGVRLSIPRPP